MGHRVFPDLPKYSINGTTNTVTMLRNPWNRLQSTYQYLLSKPESNMLAPEINNTHMFGSVTSFYEFVMFPGISNCMTKMFNGYQCGQDIELNDRHLDIAKKVLLSMLFVGITEKFKTSVCMMSWMYGGKVESYHFGKFRENVYQRKAINDIFTPIQRFSFLFNERFDIALYDYANSLFEHRLNHTRCPMID